MSERCEQDDLIQWIVSAIKQAESDWRLELLGEAIKLDKEDGEEYTKDDGSMRDIRREWSVRFGELKKGRT